MIEQEGIKIETKLIDNDFPITLVEVEGYIDQGNCHLLQQAIDECLESENFKLIFDLQKLVYMSSAGWGVLIGEIKRFRESGGDIKITNLGSEIYEIYQMLEFYHIISEYPSVEDAKKSFYSNSDVNSMSEISSYTKDPDVKSPSSDNKLNIDSKDKDAEYQSHFDYSEKVNKTDNYTNSNDNDEEDKLVEDIDVNIDNILNNEELAHSEEKVDKTEYVEFDPKKYKRKPDITVMPVPDKIRAIIGQNPYLSPRKIKKMLKQPGYGNVKIGYFKLKSILKSLDLNTKEKRIRFFRSA